MQDFERLGVFYLGRSKEGLLLYDSKDLTTHAVCVGMTGSGKTGLCLSLLEEAAIDGLPALAIDPKGDLTNLLLTFPKLAPEDFEPWVNADAARQQGITVPQLASATAAKWKAGLAEWGEDGARIARLRNSASFTIYTPGSDAGVPLSILHSFAAPEAALRDDPEAFRDRISSTTTAVLGLLNIDSNPMQSREHILLSKIFETAWNAGSDLDLAALIGQIQNPPIEKIGVMDIETFYPAKDRFALSMALNTLLASPGFEAWLRGEPMDVSKLLYDEQGKPRISICTISHLNDAERMFFVSLLLNQVVAWMRSQPGTTSLRALIYMDEIFGYFPPVQNPPSKQPLLTLLKQARAYGLGVVLATQNPIDLDYKGLSNAGTWFIGRLQTERDQKRLLEGLAAAASEMGGSTDSAAVGGRISSLKSRSFLINNVHRGTLTEFESRWALSYLAGPLTRAQIKTLTRSRPTAAPEPRKQSASRPLLPPEVPQHFLPHRGTEPPVYSPAVLGAAEIRFVDAKSNIDVTRDIVLCAHFSNGAVPMDWAAGETLDIEIGELEQAPEAGAQFGDLPGAATKAKNYSDWSKALVNRLFATQKLDLMRSPNLGVISNPGESERDFRIRIQQPARESRDADVGALQRQYAAKLAALDDRIRRAQQTLATQEHQATQSKVATGLSILTTVAGAFLGKGFLTKTSMTSASSAARSLGRATKESQDVTAAEANLKAAEEQKAALEAQLTQDTLALQGRYDAQNEVFEPVTVLPKKTNIAVKLVCLCWKPE